MIKAILENQLIKIHFSHEQTTNRIYFLNAFRPVVQEEMLFKQDKFAEFISPDEGLFERSCKSQNIHPIYLNLKSTFGIIQIITNAFQVRFSA